MFPVAQYETHENSIPFLTAVGDFTCDGHRCFAAAAAAKRVYVYDTMEQPDAAKSYVKVGQKVTCVQSCVYNQRDCLVIGTDTSVQLFDTTSNAQIFNVLVSDGVSAITVFDGRYIYVGSNCSILGYDFSGNEVFWTVTGDIVSAMCEIEWNGSKCVLVASQDLMIRLFNGEEAIRERRVHSKVSFLKSLGPQKYAIAFEHGSVTLIDGPAKVWDVATGGQIVGLQVVDYSGAGKSDVAYATAEGAIGVLDVDTGRVTCSDDTKLRLSGLHLIDLKGDKHMCLVVIGTNGSVRVFMPKRTEGLGAEAKKEFDLKVAQPTLIKEKARLLMCEYELTSGSDTNAVAALPRGVNVKFTLGQRLDLGCAELQLKTEPPTPIQGSVVEASTTSGSDFVMFEINKPAEPEQNIPLNTPDDATGDMKVDVFVSGIIISFTCQYQKFFRFQMVKDVSPSSYVEFATSGSAFADFVSKSFVTGNVGGSTFKVSFRSLDKKEPMVLSSNGVKSRIECETVETAAKIIGEYCAFAKIAEFECIARFPNEVAEIERIAAEESAANETNIVHKVEVAGLIAQVKDIIVRIENAELIGQYQVLHDSVCECERLNAEIAREHVKRMTNRDAAGESQRLNALIQKFAELRKGNVRNAMLQLCRKEIQNKNIKNLIVVLETGKAVSARGKS